MRNLALLALAWTMLVVACAETETNGGNADATDDASAAVEEDADTGRMSDTEYEGLVRFIDEFDSERVAFADQLASKCATLFTAGALADGSDCVREAYDGTFDDGVLAYTEAKDLRGDVAKGCKRQLSTFMKRLDRYGTYLGNLAESGEMLDVKQFRFLANRSGRETRRYERSREKMLAACEPR